MVTEQYLKPFLASLILSINSEITHEKKRCEWGGSANSYESSLPEFGELCALGFEVTDLVMENKKTKTVTFQLRWCDLPPAVSVLPYDVMYLSLGQWVVIFNKKRELHCLCKLKKLFQCCFKLYVLTQHLSYDLQNGCLLKFCTLSSSFASTLCWPWQFSKSRSPEVQYI